MLTYKKLLKVHFKLIVLFRNKNLNCTQISEKLNVSHDTVKKVLRENGFKHKRENGFKHKRANGFKHFKYGNATKIKVENTCLNCLKPHFNKNFCSKSCTLNYVNEHTIKTEEGRLIQSERMKKKLSDGTIQSSRCEWYDISCSKGIVKAQGKFEVRAIRILELLVKNEKIKSWERNCDYIHYFDLNNSNRNYLPDFKVYEKDNTFYYLEVKGFLRENDYLKIESVKNKNLRIEIWFNEELRKFEKEYKLKISIVEYLENSPLAHLGRA